MTVLGSDEEIMGIGTATVCFRYRITICKNLVIGEKYHLSSYSCLLRLVKIDREEIKTTRRLKTITNLVGRRDTQISPLDGVAIRLQAVHYLNSNDMV